MSRSRFTPAIGFVLLLVILIGLFALSAVFKVDSEKLTAFLNRIPFVPMVAGFFLTYTFATLFLWTLEDPLQLLSAIIFGAYGSTLLIFISETIASCIFFSLTRKLGRDFVEKKIGGRFKKFHSRLKNLNFWFLVVLRANPLIPLRVLDLSLALTRVSFRKYFSVMILATLPRIFWSQYPMAALRGLSPEKIMAYINENPMIMALEVLYIAVVLVATFAMRKYSAQDQKDVFNAESN